MSASESTSGDAVLEVPGVSVSPPVDHETGVADDVQVVADAPDSRKQSPAWVAVSKPHPSEARTPEIVIPAKAGIQAGWSGETPL